MTIPETPTVNVRMSTQLLRELEQSKGPLRMAALYGPDDEGFYEPALVLVTNGPTDPWYRRIWLALTR